MFRRRDRGGSAFGRGLCCEVDAGIVDSPAVRLAIHTAAFEDESCSNATVGRASSARRRPMIEITINAAAYEAILTTLKDCSLVVPAKRIATGDYLAQLDEKTVTRLAEMRGPNESYSDVILRIVGREAETG
jgi:hypothetical protein